MALAYFITFTTYGTWLHGTSKAKGSVDAEHNAYGSAFVQPDADRLATAQKQMMQPPYIMDAAQRAVVCDAIVEMGREKGWKVWAAHVRSNHVHVVITADREPGRLMSDLKGRASSALNRAGLDEPDRRRWTRHGSTKHLFTEAQVREKIRYTLDGQGVRMAWFDGAMMRTNEEPRTK